MSYNVYTHLTNIMASIAYTHAASFPIASATGQVYISSDSGHKICYKDVFELTCWYPSVGIPGRYLGHRPGWNVNGSILTVMDTTYYTKDVNITATKLVVNVTDIFSTNTAMVYGCFQVFEVTKMYDESTENVHVTING